MKNKIVILALTIVFTGIAAAQMVPLGAPADAPPLKWVLEEGNVSSTGINMSFYSVSSIAHPNAPRDAATKGYVDGQIISQTTDDQTLGEVLSENNTATRNIDANGYNITSSGGEICIGEYC